MCLFFSEWIKDIDINFKQCFKEWLCLLAIVEQQRCMTNHQSRQCRKQLTTWSLGSQHMVATTAQPSTKRCTVLTLKNITVVMTMQLFNKHSVFWRLFWGMAWGINFRVSYCCIATVSWPTCCPRLLKMHLGHPRPYDLLYLAEGIKASVTHEKTLQSAPSALLHVPEKQTVPHHWALHLMSSISHTALCLSEGLLH